MTDYRFDSTWMMEAPIDGVFDALRDYETHPSWWQDVRSTNSTDRLGVTVRYEIQSPLLYSLSFDVALAAPSGPI